MTATQSKRDIYKKLSGFGVFVWFGMAVCMFIISASVSYEYYAYNYTNNGLQIAGLIAFVVFILLLLCACSDRVYCKYKYIPGMESNLFSVSGRMPRSVFWIYFAVLMLMYFVVRLVPITSPAERVMPFLVMIPFQIAFFTAAIRRSQDCGFYPWLPLIPVISIILFFVPSDKDNAYGPRKTQATKLKQLGKIKAEIVNNSGYLGKEKTDRIEYLQHLKKQTVNELTKTKNALQSEVNKLKDVPEDIAKYIKPQDTSVLQKNISNLEDKLEAIEELIRLEQA